MAAQSAPTPPGALSHLPGNMQIGPQRRCRKNPAITASSPVVTAVRSPEVPRPLRRMPAQLGQVHRSRPKIRTTMPGCTMGYTWQVMAIIRVDFPLRGSQDRNVLARANLQIHVVQHHPLAARDIDLPQFKKLCRLLFDFDRRTGDSRLLGCNAAMVAALHWYINLSARSTRLSAVLLVAPERRPLRSTWGCLSISRGRRLMQEDNASLGQVLQAFLAHVADNRQKLIAAQRPRCRWGARGSQCLPRFLQGPVSAGVAKLS